MLRSGAFRCLVCVPMMVQLFDAVFRLNKLATESADGQSTPASGQRQLHFEFSIHFTIDSTCPSTKWYTIKQFKFICAQDESLFFQVFMVDFVHLRRLFFHIFFFLLIPSINSNRFEMVHFHSHLIGHNRHWICACVCVADRPCWIWNGHYNDGVYCFTFLASISNHRKCVHIIENGRI